MYLRHDEAEADFEEENENEPPPVQISTTDLTEQLREAARRKKEDKVCAFFSNTCSALEKLTIWERQTYHVFDADDVDWVAQDVASDDEFDIREVEDRVRRTSGRRPNNDAEFDDLVRFNFHSFFLTARSLLGGEVPVTASSG